MTDKEQLLAGLKPTLKGELELNELHRIMYATDASAYREKPLGVVFPGSADDVGKIVSFAAAHKLPLIPRAGGTSLAGQVVGSGLVVDVSRHLDTILEYNHEEAWVKVEPGVIRDELNMFLQPKGRYFGPETSTANRATIGGMLGNNSCGSNSVVYGSVRDHILEVEGYLSDGSFVTLGPVDKNTFHEKCRLQSLEGDIYRKVNAILADKEKRQKITDAYPLPSVHRRNTGYALDVLMQNEVFGDIKRPFNMAELVAGSEGTLLFATAVKLKVMPLPPAHKQLVCIHCHSVDESLHANLIALKYEPHASELMDHYILECTKNNREYKPYRWFIQGDPKALLVVELAASTKHDLDIKTEKLISDLVAEKLGYHYALVSGEEVQKVWKLRKAGLGLLSNIPGDAKPVPVIEDTAVDVNDLPAYIREFNQILDKYGLYCVHYAHAGSGELHLRPIINLKTKEGNALFKKIADEIAGLVKKYRGSLSGEHGDGRLRGEYISFMLGDEVYSWLKEVKNTADPSNIFNPGKIIDTPAMNTSLRYAPGQETRELNTILDFSDYEGYLRTAELCNGSGDCRKTHLSGGVMCPSYMATRDEKDTTRARANVLREVITRSEKENPFDSEEIHDAMDLCLSCKGCKSECPSNVDMGKLKAEYLYQYYASNGIPWQARIFANFTRLQSLASAFSFVYNPLIKNELTASVIKSIAGMAKPRSLPLVHRQTFRQWFRRNKAVNFGEPVPKEWIRDVYIFVDEFTNYHDVEIGKKTVQLLTRLGYRVHTIDHKESGRTFISKGLLEHARVIAKYNVDVFSKVNGPVIGIEPSAVLTFRDEYIDLLRGEAKQKAIQLASRVFLIEEFIADAFEKNEISEEQFTQSDKKIKVHGHCYQKALGAVVPVKKMLNIPKNYKATMIPSGCCGMAGSFGYEKEHYDVSMKIAELVLFPAIRKAENDELVAASGTSCRHQIRDGLNMEALHPVQILYEALL